MLRGPVRYGKSRIKLEEEATFRGSVLSLTLSQDGQLLFSTAGDRFVNVWDTKSLLRVYSIYSTYDIGDIFCVSYSSTLNTVYLGAQNTSIQWYDLNEKDRRPKPTPILHPWLREDRFFDSLGPGGIRTPRPGSIKDHPQHAEGGQDLEIDKMHIRQYAHYGYVYCMILARGLRDDPNEEVLISGGGDGAIKLWRIGGEEGAISELHKLDDGRDEGDSVLSFVLDGAFLYAGRINGEVNVWDLETRQLVRNLRTKTEDVLALSMGGGYLFCAGVSGTVDKYNSQYEMVSRFKAHNGRILASAFTRFRNQFFYITGGNDDTITIWNISDCVQGNLTDAKTSNEKLVQALKQFVSYETVSSDLRYQASCRKGASHLRSVFRNFGAQTTMLGLENPEWNPVILAKFKGNPSTSAQRKKILFYGHYDVIPADDEQGKWICKPFQMEGINDYLYGRGTSDNKGPIMAAIFAVAELVAQKALDSDIIFLIEGEEESGSRGFEQAVKTNKHLIGDVDWILLANSYWLDDHVPCLTYGLRGVIHATVEVKSTHPDLHSGVDGSSLLDESVKDLVSLLAKLTGKSNRIEIPFFYDPILPLSKDEEALYQEITRTLIDRNPSLGDPHELAETLQRRWREASLTIHRFYTSGPDNSTIIPSVAKAAISLRLVPEQTAQEVASGLTSFLEGQFEELGSKNQLTVAIDHKSEPWLGDYNNKIFQTLEEAIIEAWSDKSCTPSSAVSRRRRSSASVAKLATWSNGKASSRKPTKLSPTTSSTLATGSITPPEDASDVENLLPSPPPRPSDGSYFPSRHNSMPVSDKKRKPLYIREGGSIPAIRFLEKEFSAPAAHFPVGQASDSAHLDNERLRVTNLYKAKEVFGYVFRELPKR
ncbi:hypothetical protein FKW77_007817 [Venturia effusa]|uniref:Peptidase M20 dimerisation domain-containing protein n=1 Tax=Venturia effusa TaxID=50376 RepID=A0A517L9M2_9PEZI|nr:hypothetical protein FKW77_007817 [Venturia effusa]